MPGLIFIVALMLQQAPVSPQVQVETLTVEASEPRKQPTLADGEIERQLDDLLAKEPNRVICLYRTPTGTRLPRPFCHTLSGWYDFEAARGGAANRGGGSGLRPPPYELVKLIKDRMRNPKTRAMAEARAGARLQAEAEARADEP
jgi:hypothetical protein